MAQTNLPPPPNVGGSERELTDLEKLQEAIPGFKPPTTAEDIRDEFDWRTKLRTDMVQLAESWAEDFGLDKFALDALVRDKIDGAINFVNKYVFQPRSTQLGVGQPWEAWEPQNASDWQEVYDAASLFYSLEVGFDLSSAPASRGSGRTGAAGPTAEDIRNQYDEDELTDGVNKMWRAYLIEEAPNARAVAREFINNMVATRGEKAIDFETFVLQNIRNTSSYKRIYRNKAEGISEQQYIQPYIQAALQVVGGGSQDIIQQVAGGAAALGTNPEAFRERLGRTDAARNSVGFMQRLEQEVGNVRNVLRG